MPWPGPPLWVCRVWKKKKEKSSRCSVSPWLYCHCPLLTRKISPPLLLPSFSFSEIQQWQIRMLSSKWQSAKTSIKLLIEETVGWGKGACDVVCVGMTELVLQRWEVTETCQRSQSARGQPHCAVNPHCSFVAALIDAKRISKQIKCTHAFMYTYLCTPHLSLTLHHACININSYAIMKHRWGN